jgi:hypothetical protein
MNKNILQTCVFLAAAGMLAWLGAGCSSDGGAQAKGGSTQPVESVAVRKGGAELWAETCGHCHNIRSPSEYNAQEWQVIVHHMRLRAGLTGYEQQEITKFLKSASAQ